MNNISTAFGSLYHPQKAFLIYQQQGSANGDKIYIESYDIAPNGNPVNAHPLSVTEGAALAKALQINENSKGSFLKSAGLLPKNLLYINCEKNGFAIWHTPKQVIKLL